MATMSMQDGIRALLETADTRRRTVRRVIGFAIAYNTLAAGASLDEVLRQRGRRFFTLSLILLVIAYIFVITRWMN